MGALASQWRQASALEIIIFTAGTFLMRSAGCAINDAFDKHFDAQVERTKNRVVATGEVSRKAAVAVGLSLALTAGLLALLLKPAAQWWCIPALFIAFTYPTFKRFFGIPQLYLGLAFSCGIPMAYAQYHGAVPWQGWLVFLTNFVWIVAYDTAYAMADKPDDLKIGIKTSAIYFGKYDALMFALLQALFLVLFASVLVVYSLGVFAWLAWLIAIYLVQLQIKPVFSRDRAACLKAFLDNHAVGMVLLIGLVFEGLL